MGLRDFVAELKRRNVYKVAMAYAVVAWLLIQIATQVFPFFEIPSWAVRLVVLLFILGFPLTVVLAWAFEITPEGIKRAEDVRPDESTARKTGRKLVGITVAVAVVAAGLFVSQLWRPRSAPSVGAQVAGTPAGSADSAALDKSVAVLPFENLSSDKENAFFAQGVQDEIITTLSRISGLRVISRTSTVRYSSAPENLPEIAH